MYACEEFLETYQDIRFPRFKAFELDERECFEKYNRLFHPVSCEYNFANLFSWQESNQLSWTIYQDRILIHDALSKNFFMPFGKVFNPREMVLLSLQLIEAGYPAVFSLCPEAYIETYPEIERFFNIESNRDIAEYVYDVEALSRLTGVKLHKKRNLISQFKRSWPDYEVLPLKGDYRAQSFSLAQSLLEKYKKPPRSLKHEFSALRTSFEYFDALDIDGIAVVLDKKVIAFSVFSRLNKDTYDIQFEKADINFKGSSQLINQETAIYLKDSCRFLNREQDLGVKGLRQAKMSYEPEKLIEFKTLVYTP